MTNEALRNSFKKIKQEMEYLSSEISSLKKEIINLYEILYQIDLIKNTKKAQNIQSSISTTDIQQISENPADNPEYNKELNLKSHISIGNEGVPADSQQTVNRQIIQENQLKDQKDKEEDSKISILIDNLKTDLKEKFKSLTKQEFLIFSLIYSLTEEFGEANYKDIALRSKLTESSIRDYVTRLEHKGIPLIKEKKNNKLVVIKVPKELRDLATLDSLTKLKSY
jgi:hypothetical protein